jgi:hypothetical protein
MTATANARRMSRGLRTLHFAALPGARADAVAS